MPRVHQNGQRTPVLKRFKKSFKILRSMKQKNLHYVKKKNK